MPQLNRDDLFSLEKYAAIRPQYRQEVMAHKKSRQVQLGPHATLYFEDRMTIQYQVQEMLRIERIFESQGIDDELEAYNPLIPDGSNWKATFMVEYPDVEERRQALARLIGIEKRVWVKIEGFDPVFPIANEDLERETEEKTSAVHFLRFELSPEMVAAAKAGKPVGMGIDHENYHHQVMPLPEPIRVSLVKDLS